LKKSINISLKSIGLILAILYCLGISGMILLGYYAMEIKRGYEIQLSQQDTIISSLKAKVKILSEEGTIGWYEVSLDSIYEYEGIGTGHKIPQMEFHAWPFKTDWDTFKLKLNQ